MDTDPTTLTLGDVANVEASDPLLPIGAGLRDAIDPLQWAWLRATESAVAAAFPATRRRPGVLRSGMSSIGVDSWRPMNWWHAIGQ